MGDCRGKKGEEKADSFQAVKRSASAAMQQRRGSLLLSPQEWQREREGIRLC